MKRPLIRHMRCSKRVAGKPDPRMAEDFEQAQVFVPVSDKEKIVVRLLYVCPECGFTVLVDL